MTGFDSKRKAAQDKLEQWDMPSEAFNNWWDSDYDDSTNPYERDSFAYWAWAGWQAALAQPAQEPVRECNSIDCQYIDGLGKTDCEWCRPKKSTPPQRIWVGLTNEDYNDIFKKARTGEHAVQLAEARLKEKNG